MQKINVTDPTQVPQAWWATSTSSSMTRTIGMAPPRLRCYTVAWLHEDLHYSDNDTPKPETCLAL